MALLLAEGGSIRVRRFIVTALFFARGARALRPAARRLGRRPGRLASVAASRAEAFAPPAQQQSVPVYASPEPPAPTELPIAYGDVVVVNDVATARAVAERLGAAPDRYHAVDTEVDGIDLSKDGPVGNGVVTCFTVYSGPDFSYDGVATGKALFVDTTQPDVLQAFQGFFASSSLKKVWHNYGFDRHVIENMKMELNGFGGDTMHMARLYDSSRLKTYGGDGYSLASLSADLLGDGGAKVSMKTLFPEFFRKKRIEGEGTSRKSYLDVLGMQTDPLTRDSFICYAAYDAKCTWEVHDVLRVKLMNQGWEPMANGVKDKDTPVTMWDFYERYFVPFGGLLTDMEAAGIYVDAKGHLQAVEKAAEKDKVLALKTFMDWCISIMGEDGRLFNPASSKQIQTLLFGGSANQKTGELLEREREFDVDVPFDDAPVEVVSEEVSVTREEFYTKATAKLLKAECVKRSLKGTGTKAQLIERLRNADAGVLVEVLIGTEDAPPPLTSAEIHELSTAKVMKDALRARGLKLSGKKDELRQRLLDDSAAFKPPKAAATGLHAVYAALDVPQLESACHVRSLEVPPAATRDQLLAMLTDDDSYAAVLTTHAQASAQTFSLPASSRKTKRKLLVKSMGLQPQKFTATGWASCTADVLRDLAGRPKDGVWGDALNAFGGGKDGERACEALDALNAMGSIDTMLGTFIKPLQHLADDESRVHCSLNLNTETGRLSSRRPNLQNQPALDKDQYLIRKAFQAKEGCSLVVADYGQLELRLLAHVAQCESMLTAFREGGCFHSRTAVGMFDHVRKAVEDGEVLLERGTGEIDKPLVKDKFAAERRRAKTLNFSIAYGKTAHGLAKDWGVSQTEAQSMLRAWYDDRPEVEKWQKDTIAAARKSGYTTTLMGRRRQLPDLLERNRALQGRGARAAINTPIQGSAADVVMMAMLAIGASPVLKELGYTLLLQIHDEVILEGPSEHSDAALAELIKLMEHPFDGVGLDPLQVDLIVDAAVAGNWYEAK